MTVLSTVFAAAIGALLAWFGANWIGKPIVEARAMRIKAPRVAEHDAWVTGGASDDRIRAARAALNDAASGLRSISRGHSWPVRLYCRFSGIDLELAARVLIQLHNIAGDFGYDTDMRQRLVEPMSRSLLNIAKRSLLRLMLSSVGLASKHAAGGVSGLARFQGGT